MNQDRFIRLHIDDWGHAEALLDQLEASATKSVVDLGGFPALYRRCCLHLAIVRQRNYEPAVEERLHDIALRGHNLLYRGKKHSLKSVMDFLLAGFPRLIRQRAGLFWLATALLYLPAIGAAVMVWADADAIYSILSPEQVAEYEAMYAERPVEERGSAMDFSAFGFYIQNNISVAFRTFAGGIFAGIGTVLLLIINGLLLGAVVANHVEAGIAANLLSFVITHGAFELTAIVIAGMAGLELGGAIVSPGRLTRTEALRRAASVGVRLIAGVTIMLVIAAYIEAFWSSTAWASVGLKVSTGAVAWLLVTIYLVFGGRTRDVLGWQTRDVLGARTTGGSRTLAPKPAAGPRPLA